MDALSHLIDAFRCLPGVGPKSAQRMVYYLLQQHQRQRGLHLAHCLQEAMNIIQHCTRCNNYTTEEHCSLCKSTERDISMLCVVEQPSDVIAIEQSNSYRGFYFVLMGKLSPLDGIGPNEIHLPQLKTLITNSNVKEIILALSPSIEGRTTMHYIRELLQPLQVHITQLAQGIPTGGELEYLDSYTIGNALRNRGIIHVGS